MKSLERAWSSLAHSQYIVGLGGLSLTWMTATEMGPQDREAILLSVFVGCCTLLFYLGHRLIGVRLHPKLSKVSRFGYFESNILRLIGAALIPILLGFWTGAAVLSIIALPILLLPMVACTLYALPLLSQKRLRDLSYIKLPVIGCIWATVTVWWPAQVQEIPIADTWGMWTTRCLYIMAITIPFDIRDEELDQSFGLKTLVTRWSAASAKKIAYTMLLTALAIHMVLLTSDTITPPYLIASLLAFGVSAILIYKANKQQPEYYFSGYVDATMILMGLYYLISKTL